MTYFGFWLFCTCIWTERVRKLFGTSLILNEFSCGKMQMPCLRKQQMNIEVSYVMRFIFLLQSLLEVVWKNTASIATALR